MRVSKTVVQQIIIIIINYTHVLAGSTSTDPVTELTAHGDTDKRADDTTKETETGLPGLKVVRRSGKGRVEVGSDRHEETNGDGEHPGGEEDG